MAGLDLAIHVLTTFIVAKTWMRGSSPRMTIFSLITMRAPSAHPTFLPQAGGLRKSRSYEFALTRQRWMPSHRADMDATCAAWGKRMMALVKKAEWH
jgi:hypothetical protein